MLLYLICLCDIIRDVNICTKLRKFGYLKIYNATYNLYNLYRNYKN